MNKFDFGIYIGNNMIKGQADNVAVIVMPKFYIPKGKCYIDGTLLQNEDEICFNSLYQSGTYFADWIDLVGNADLIHATIYLNILSLHKSFKGNDIIACINKLEKINNRSELRTFNKLI